MGMETGENNSSWIDKRIKRDEITRYLDNGKDFIFDKEIEEKLKNNLNPEPARIRDILSKSLSIQGLTADETAALLHVTDEKLLDEMKDVALKIKKKVLNIYQNC